MPRYTAGMIWLLAMLPSLAVAAALTALEWRRGVRDADWRCNLWAWALQIAVAMTILPREPQWLGPPLIAADRLPFWAGFALFFIVRDFGEYIYHRAQHRLPLLWAMHALHHSDPDMSALTTQRHFWGDQLVKQVTIWSATAMIVRPTPGIAAAYGLATLWNFVVHTNQRWSLGRWSWLINSPAYHRRHHSALPPHYDSNFAALLPIFDVLFGSYHRPDGFPPTGLDRRPRTLADLLLWPVAARRGAPVIRA